MYNQEIKERFLSEYDGNRKSGARQIFEVVSEYEAACNKDLAQMQKSEICEALKYAQIGTYSTAFGVLSFVRSYVKWCDDNLVFSGISVDDSMLVVDDIDISDSIQRLYFRTENELINCLKSVRPLDDGYYDIIVTLFSWLGIPQKQVANIKISDVDLENKTVRFDGAYIQFSDNIKEILALYAKTKTGTREAAGGQRVVYRDDSYDTFVRRFSPPKQLGKKITTSQIEDSVYLLNKAYVEAGNSPRFTGGNVLASGALRRVYELEQSGVDVFSIKNKDLVVNAYRVKAKLYEILWQYKNYKKAFNL